METLKRLLDEITSGELILARTFVRDDLEQILDRRDEGAFEKPWLACSERITSAWEQAEPAEDVKGLMDEVRKQSFLVVSRATHQHEIASYVSDDFELIAKSIALGLGDAYAEALLATYRAGGIPRAEPRAES